jgi:hypothetical protein
MSILSRNWWVIAVCAVTTITYFHFRNEKKETLSEMTDRLEKMEEKKLLQLEKRDDLQLRIASQSDPAWIEMVLIRDLGVVPEGFLKVHFNQK